jgi:YVTN family beta-propeller protein
VRAAAALLLSTLFAAGAPGASVTARVTVGLQPCAEIAGFGSVWVANYGSSTLSRIDPKTNRVVGTVHVGTEPCGLAAGAGSIWVDGYGTGTVERVDPEAMRRVAAIGAGPSVWDVAFDGKHAWADANGDGTVVEIDPATNRVVRRVVVGHSPTGLAVAHGSLWVGNNGYADRTFARVDLGSGKVTRVTPGCSRPAYFAVSGAADPWVTCVGVTRGTAVRIDPRTNAVVARVPLGNTPGDGAFGADGLVYVPNKLDGTVTRIDPRTNRAVQTVRVGGTPFVLNEAFGDVWVPDGAGRVVARLSP